MVVKKKKSPNQKENPNPGTLECGLFWKSGFADISKLR
jgi:hypothetical protein